MRSRRYARGVCRRRRGVKGEVDRQMRWSKRNLVSTLGLSLSKSPALIQYQERVPLRVRVVQRDRDPPTAAEEQTREPLRGHPEGTCEYSKQRGDTCDA